MDGELNELKYNNTNITFSVATNNIATSDELSADPIYVRQMGTNYSRGKKVGKAITIVGISVAFTATAIASGGVLRNIFIPNPPTVSNAHMVVEGNQLEYGFTIENKLQYKTWYELYRYGDVVAQGECIEAREYVVKYSPVEKGEKYKFIVIFTNSFDYRKEIHTNEFVI